MAKKSNFSINWNKVMWKETMWLNFLRAVCVTPIVVAIQASQSSSILVGLLWPIYYFMAVPILLFVIRPMIFLVGGPLAPLVWIPLCLMLICGGDPIVFLISKIKPQLVPIQGFKFINFELFIFVEKPENRRNGEGEMFDSDY
jgi:hypothetical protein